MDKDALKVVIEELERNGRWYHDLAARLATCYEPRLKQLAQNVVDAVWSLRNRLSYDTDALVHAVYSLRALLADGPMRGDRVAEWARTANITHGLLFLARKLVGIVICQVPQRSGGHLSRDCYWVLEDQAKDFDARKWAANEDEEPHGRWQQRKERREG